MAIKKPSGASFTKDKIYAYHKTIPMKKLSAQMPLLTSYFLVLLFVYAGASKLMDFENFQIKLAQSPVVSAYADPLSYAVIGIEFVISIALLFQATRLTGLYASFGLMAAFTAYIYIILTYSEFIPCSCGGILEKLGWTEHLVFNIICVVLCALSIIIIEKKLQNKGNIYISKISVSFISSVVLVIVLYQSSEYIIKKENNFTRRFFPHAIDQGIPLDLKANSFYFAGNFSDSIYLANITAPLIIGKIYPEYKELVLDTLDLDNKGLDFKGITVQINYPSFTISDGKIPAIYEGQFPNKTAHILKNNSIFFSQLMMIERGHYLFRTHHKIKKENIVGTIQFNKGEQLPSVKFNDQFLEKQIDGLFDTDGLFVRDLKTGEFIYTYYYRNEYRRINKELKLLGSGRTIDSTFKAQITVTKTNNGQIKMTRPPLKVNNIQYAYDGFLFNHSNLRGRHESEKLWKNSAIIDVYDYRRNIYLYSFPVRHKPDEKVKDFIVTKDHIYVLTGQNIIKYKRAYKPRI